MAVALMVGMRKTSLGNPALIHTEVVAEFGDVKIDQSIDRDGWWKSKPREEFSQSSSAGSKD